MWKATRGGKTLVVTQAEEAARLQRQGFRLELMGKKAAEPKAPAGEPLTVEPDGPKPKDTKKKSKETSAEGFGER